MTRPIGTRLREVCEIVEREGACTWDYISMHMDCTRTATNSYLTRCVKQGLLTVSRFDKRNHWTVVKGWREKVRQSDWEVANPVVIRPLKFKPHPLHGIWK